MHEQPSKLLHAELSSQIIGAAITVLNELRPGLHEKLYERALVIELEERGIKVSQQLQFPVYYKGRRIGKLVPDLVVEGKIIVDTKVVECFHDTHFAKMIGYLAKTSLDLGMLLNFKYSELKWKRVIRSTALPS